MNLGGIKISSAEVERVLNSVEGIRETGAISFVPAEGGLEHLVVYAVPEPGAESNGKSLKVACQQLLAERLNSLFRIHDLVIVDALPRTASNKVMRRELRRHYLSISGSAERRPANQCTDGEPYKKGNALIEVLFHNPLPVLPVLRSVRAAVESAAIERRRLKSFPLPRRWPSTAESWRSCILRSCCRLGGTPPRARTLPRTAALGPASPPRKSTTES